MKKKHSTFSILYLWIYMLSLMGAAQSISKHDVVGAAAAGDTPASPKGWVVPTNAKKLRVVVPIKADFTEFIQVTWNADNSTKVEGFCIDVFDAVMAALPYGLRYEYVPFAKADHTTAGDYNNLTYQVYLGNYDAVAGDVINIGNRSEYMDFTMPYTVLGVAMGVPNVDDKSMNTWVFLKPVTWELWLTSFSLFLLIGVLIWTLLDDIVIFQSL